MPTKPTKQRSTASSPQPTPATPHTRLGTTFGLATDNLLVTPIIGGAPQLRYRRPPWAGPPFRAFQTISNKALHFGDGLYIGAQTLSIGAPALAVP